jgi:hypothetical protein
MPALVTVQGVLKSKDIEAFRFRIAKLSKAIVAFESDGGSLLAGIRIGELIRMKGFITVVPVGARCASAYAIAWLGGVKRFMGEPALVGFHAAYRDDGTGPTEFGSANAWGIPERNRPVRERYSLRYDVSSYFDDMADSAGGCEVWN